VDSSDSEKGLVIDVCENGNELLCSITGREYFDCKGECQLIKGRLQHEVSQWLDQGCKLVATRSIVKPTAGV
jgi:hypothetical protein